jgi:hypothetical protein
MATNPGPTATPTPPRRRFKKRYLILAVAAVLAGALLVLIVRGTWADTRLRNPQVPADGAVCYLYQAPDGHKEVRAALVLDCPAAAVWSVVTDYDHFSDIFPYERSTHWEPDPDGRIHLTGLAHSRLYGDWPFDVHVRHEETPDGKIASWDGPTPDLPVNRGSWTVTPLGPDRTLLVLSIEWRMRHVPDFYTHNILLDRLKPMVRAVGRRCQGEHPARG